MSTSKPAPSTMTLPSWRDGVTKGHILDFLDRAEEIPPDERVAVFDNDGTLWCEKPEYPQAEFLYAELKRAAVADPGIADREEYRAVLEGDRDALSRLDLVQVAMALVDLHTGLTPEAFQALVIDFADRFRHADLGKPLRQLRYRPMLELLEALRVKGFDIYLVTAGGAEFVRAISNSLYGIKPEGVVGSQIDYDIVRDEGNVHLTRTNRLVGAGPNEGPTKPSSIQRMIGRRPCVAAGNSAGDAEMLQYAAGYEGPSLSLLVNHDDQAREYSYESVAGTFHTDETILETAARLEWVVTSIRDDWATVFAES